MEVCRAAFKYAHALNATLDTPSRPSFRATVSQPSQMGNFKHQSLRSDRDRDERDREGIRNVSSRFLASSTSSQFAVPRCLRDTTATAWVSA